MDDGALHRSINTLTLILCVAIVVGGLSVARVLNAVYLIVNSNAEVLTKHNAEIVQRLNTIESRLRSK